MVNGNMASGASGQPPVVGRLAHEPPEYVLQPVEASVAIQSQQSRALHAVLQQGRGRMANGLLGVQHVAMRCVIALPRAVTLPVEEAVRRRSCTSPATSAARDLVLGFMDPGRNGQHHAVMESELVIQLSAMLAVVEIALINGS